MENIHPEAIIGDVGWKPHFLSSFANCFSNAFAQSDQGVWVMWKHYSCLEVDDCNSWLRYFAKLLTIFKVFNLKLFWASLCCTAENTRDKTILITSRIILLIPRHAWALNTLIKGSSTNLLWDKLWILVLRWLAQTFFPYVSVCVSL